MIQYLSNGNDGDNQMSGSGGPGHMGSGIPNEDVVTAVAAKTLAPGVMRLNFGQFSDYYQVSIKLHSQHLNT